MIPTGKHADGRFSVKLMPSSLETWRQIEIPKISGMWYFGDSFSMILD
jgi:hypothetical protein